MQRIIVKSTARADVTETWTFDLPDDHPTITNVDEIDLDELMEAGTFVSCEDDVDNEEDREIQSFHYEEDASAGR